jgi:radical SAM superfamily enzyme YgiQ (UPF0313 family)
MSSKVLGMRKDRRYTHLGTKGFHVTLVRPPAVSSADSVNASSLTPPLALAYLSACLREAGFSVTNIDAIGEGIDEVHPLERNPRMEAQGLPPEKVIALIPPETNLIGVSAMFSLEWPNTRDLILSIRRAFPHTPIVVGGEHATALPEFSMTECPAIDFIALGEGESILLGLVHTLNTGGRPSDLAGLVYRENGQPVRGKGTPNELEFEGASGARIMNLDTLKWPAWDLTPLQTYFERKLTFGRYVGRTMPIVGSRGCPYECTFCSNPAMWGRRYLTRSAKDVVREITYYKETYGIEAVEFYDLTPIIRKKWILEFCEELINQKTGIRWQISGGTRCEAIDENVIVQAKRAGCEYLGFAPESGVQEVLVRIKKRLDLRHMMNLIRLAKKHRVDTRCNIIIGFPEDTRSQIYRTLFFQMKLAFLGVVDSPIFDFTPYPGSELFNQLRKEGVIPDLSDDYFETLGLNVQFKNRRQYCRKVGPYELMFYRTFGMMLFYGMYYLTHPIKLVSFIRNLISYDRSNSVFEQRMIQNFKKRVQKLNTASRAPITDTAAKTDVVDKQAA